MASGLIQEAISAGAPAYNAGDIALCAEIYQATAMRLLSDYRRELESKVARDLEMALQTSLDLRDKRGGRGSPVDKVAWSFRGAFDSQLQQDKGTKQATKQPNGQISDIIAQAISNGAPAYNRGDVGKCVQMYKDTARQLVDRPDIDQSSKMILLAAVQQVEQSRDTNGNAWALRKALDATVENQRNTGSQSQSRAPASRPQSGKPGLIKGDIVVKGLIMDFTTGSGISVQPKVVNDTVMGGRSNSRVSNSREGVLFEGDVTKRGGGGFASVRFAADSSSSLASALQGGKGIAFSVRRIKGCKEWKICLSEGYDAVTWQADFRASSSDSNQRIAFSEFVPTWRGMPQGSKGLTASALSKITSFGFMVSFLTADGANSAAFEEGPFAVNIARIEVF
jgi:hypothetical protein